MMNLGDMKTVIFSTLLLFCGLSFVHGQTNYYQGRTTVSGDSVTYRVKVTSTGAYRIDNIHNKKAGTPLRMLDGTLADGSKGYGATQNQPYEQTLYRAVKEVLPDSVLQALKNAEEQMYIGLIVEHDGRVSEVSFIFDDDSLLTAIPPDQYYSIEQKIKRYTTFTLWSNSKDVQFVKMTGILSFKRLK